MLRKLANKLPEYARVELKRINYRRQIRNGEFKSSESEFAEVGQIIKPGDWVVDVGANIGHYTRRFSELAGHGRVIAFEPHPRTFAFLAANVSDLKNVTLINAALSGEFSEVGFSVPNGNFYQASIDATSEMKVATVSPSALGFGQKIAFIKIDAEGHEQTIIGALASLIDQHRPILMVENNLAFLKEWSEKHRYRFRDRQKSHNYILEPA